MSENWRTVMSRARPKITDELEGMDKGSLGVVENVSTETERINISDFGGGAPALVTHPYVSIRSWHRVMPEEATAAVLTRRGDNSVSEISYYHSGNPERRISNYRRGVGYYRPLDRGEFETTSFGLAQIYGSRGGSLDLRGGITRGWFNNQDLEIGFKSPTHRRVLHDNRSESLNGDERFGVVWRQSPNDGSRTYYRVDGTFAREYTRSLSFRGTPDVLVDRREGHVHDDDGVRPRAPSGGFLRKRVVYNDSEGEPSTELMDENGNTWEILSVNATSGRVFEVPRGNFRIRSGENIRMSAIKDIQVSGRNMTVRVSSVIHLEADVAIKLLSKGMIAIEAPIIEANGRSVMTATTQI